MECFCRKGRRKYEQSKHQASEIHRAKEQTDNEQLTNKSQTINEQITNLPIIKESKKEIIEEDKKGNKKEDNTPPLYPPHKGERTSQRENRKKNFQRFITQTTNCLIVHLRNFWLCEIKSKNHWLPSRH